jgi:hypothetical protein
MSKKEKTGSIMITGYKRGHKYSYEWKGLEFHLKNPSPVSIEKPCIKCGKMPTKEGHDACLGTLPGVIAACCGHGVEDGLILFENGVSIKGNFNIEIPLDEAKNKLVAFLEDYNGDMSPFLLANKLNLNYVLVNTILDELIENDNKI